MNNCSAKLNKFELIIPGAAFCIKLAILISLSVIQVSHIARAEDNSGFPLPPDIPPPVEDGEPMDQDVRIYREDKKTIYEYRVNGELYFVKVIPEIGPTYYLRDSDGDGVVDEQVQGPESGMKIHQWKLFSW